VARILRAAVMSGLKNGTLCYERFISHFLHRMTETPDFVLMRLAEMVKNGWCNLMRCCWR
jgi:hypothetical protein